MDIDISPLPDGSWPNASATFAPAGSKIPRKPERGIGMAAGRVLPAVGGLQPAKND